MSENISHVFRKNIKYNKLNKNMYYRDIGIITIT